MTNTESYTVTPPQETPRRPWPISVWIIPDALVGLVLTIIASLLLMGISLGIRIATGDAELVNGVIRLADGTVLFGPGSSPEALQKGLVTPGFFFGSILVQNLIFAAVVFVRVRVLRRLSWEWLGVQFKSFGKLVVIGIGLGIAFLVLNVVTSLIFSSLLDIHQNQADQFPVKPGDIVGQVLLFVAATVLAPIGEELLFRGYIFHAVRQDLGVIAACLSSALVFALVHIFGVTQGTVALVVPLFFGGLLLAFAVQRTGSIVPGIIAHGINNGVAIAALIACSNYPNMCMPQ